MIPRILKNFNVFVNGTGLAGLCDEAEIPEVKIKSEEHRSGGMDGVFEVDMGMEAMKAKLTFSEPLPEVITALGAGTRIQLRGSYVRDTDQSRVAVIVELQARGSSFGGGTLKAGEKAQTTSEFYVDYYRYNLAGDDLIEIDVVNMVRNIGGVDQLAGIRADIAI